MNFEPREQETSRIECTGSKTTEVIHFVWYLCHQQPSATSPWHFCKLWGPVWANKGSRGLITGGLYNDPPIPSHRLNAMDLTPQGVSEDRLLCVIRCLPAKLLKAV